MSQTIIQIPNTINQQLGNKQYLQQELNVSEKQLIQQIMYLVGSIRDPQRQQTLQELNVITEDSVTVNYLLNSTIFPQNSQILQPKNFSHNKFIIVINIEITPTVPHCHLTQQIGLAIRMKLKQQLPDNWSKKIKIIIRCKPGSHNNREQVQKQINDKERIAAALENQSVVKAIKELIKSH